jgi:hypothetical protein
MFMSKKKRHLKSTLSKAKRRVEAEPGLHEPVRNKRSIGELRKANKTKPRSPDVTGKPRLQRHTLQAIVRDFKEGGDEEIVCNIAGWKNRDQHGSYLTVEISPQYPPHEP